MQTKSDIYKKDRFFGRNKYRNHRNHFVSYDSTPDESTCIIRTNKLVFRYVKYGEVEEIQYVLMIGKELAVWVPYHNIVHSGYYKDDKYIRVDLVKLDRRYFKSMYYPHELNKEIDFQGIDTFESLYEEARLQGLQKVKVKF